MGFWQRIDLDDLLSYQTVKYLTIKERKLGIIHHTLQFIIFAYIALYTILYQQRYLLLEPPYGTIRATVKEPPTWIPAEALAYCWQNQSSSVKGFQNCNCTYMRGTDVTYPPGQIDSVFVSTRIKDTYYNTSGSCNDPINMTTLACVPPSTPSSTYRYYTANIENYTLYMEHAIFGRQNNILVSNFNCEGKMIMPNGQDIAFNEPNRTGDILSVQTIVNAADIASLDDSSGLGSSYRYDGLLIVAVVTYNNYVTRPSKFHYMYELYAMPNQDVISMQPTEVLPGGTTRQRNWYGVRVIFLVVGEIGFFDFPTLLTSLVNGLVLIKVATVIVDLMLLYILPSKKLYTKHKFEYPELSKEESRSMSERPGYSTTFAAMEIGNNARKPLLADHS